MRHRSALTGARRGGAEALPWTGALLALTLLAAGCASLGARPEAPPLAFAAPETDTLLARHAPVALVERPDRTYNRIGTVRARTTRSGTERLYVDPEESTLYVEARTFETQRGTYTNLVYRMHFEKVPFRLVPFHLTTGRNGGLVVVITLDALGAPVLVTTVHTCGCYLAFFPTSALPAAALPDGWDLASQRVHGIRLPGQLDFPADLGADARVRITLATGTHRVIDVVLGPPAEVERSSHSAPPSLLPLEALERVPLDAGTTSFYREAGARRGLVKGSFKPLELLLMSWWALDLHVGVDKRYGERGEPGALFYTSLRPWHRRASDMRDFPGFLRFWGWKL